MNAEQGQPPPGPEGGPEGQPSEEELRARLEEELRKLRVQDVLLQSVVSIINLTSRRIAKEDEQDLEQARVGIDALRALVDLLDEEPAQQVRAAISDLQMHYARAAGGGAPEPRAEEGGEAPPEPEQPSEAGRKQSGLWTPPGT
jgi:Domain of unknown function (DUF1844)